MLAPFPLQATDVDAQKVFAKYDTDGNGTLDAGLLRENKCVRIVDAASVLAC